VTGEIRVKFDGNFRVDFNANGKVTEEYAVPMER
jgi:hypothetical protein